MKFEVRESRKLDDFIEYFMFVDDELMFTIYNFLAHDDRGWEVEAHSPADKRKLIKFVKENYDFKTAYIKNEDMKSFCEIITAFAQSGDWKHDEAPALKFARRIAKKHIDPSSMTSATLDAYTRYTLYGMLAIVDLIDTGTEMGDDNTNTLKLIKEELK